MYQSKSYISYFMPNNSKTLMSKTSSIIFILLLLCVLSQTKSEFKDFVDPWNQLDVIEGKLQTNHTLFKYSTCNPCDYMILIYDDFVELLIDHPEQGKQKQNILAFQFNFDQNSNQDSFWDFDRKNIKLKQKRNINETLQRVTNQGLQWSYELTLPIQGLILKGRTDFKYESLIPLITLLTSILLFVTFPLTNKGRREQTIQIPRRTPLVSLILLAQMQHIILIQIVIISVKYLIHEDSFMMKSLWYIVFMLPFGFVVLQILYLYDSIRTKFLNTLKKVRSARIRDISLVLLLFIGIYFISGFLLFVRKGIWIYAYFGIYILWQIVQSIIVKAYPYLKLNGYFLVLLGYQMFLANYFPLFWFQQLSLKQITIFWCVIISLFILGSILQKFLIGIENVNLVLFEESKNIQMGDQSSAKSTEVNLQA